MSRKIKTKIMVLASFVTLGLLMVAGVSQGDLTAIKMVVPENIGEVVSAGVKGSLSAGAGAGAYLAINSARRRKANRLSQQNS